MKSIVVVSIIAIITITGEADILGPDTICLGGKYLPLLSFSIRYNCTAKTIHVIAIIIF